MIRSQFFYGPQVSFNDNEHVIFDEGSGEIDVSITRGGYSPSTMAAELQAVMRQAGTLVYTVAFDRATRKFTISAPSNFTLKVTTGTNAAIALWPDIGFTTDKTGSNSYTGDVVGCSQYRPQFELVKYVNPENWFSSVSESVNESANGTIELVRFGQINRTSFEIDFVTETSQLATDVIEIDASALTNLRLFLDWSTQKFPVELMHDRSTPNIFYVLQLETTESSQVGTGYKIKEFFETGRNLPDFYSTGMLQWRVIE